MGKKKSGEPMEVCLRRRLPAMIFMRSIKSAAGDSAEAGCNEINGLLLSACIGRKCKLHIPLSNHYTMTVRKLITQKLGVYFITFTCYNWLHLYQKVNGYDLVYEQFDYLKKQGHYILGYVIMPNHVHSLIAFREIDNSINAVIGNTKRFLAYAIIKRLELLKADDLLTLLANAVNSTDKKRGKLHKVFEPSFDCKECFSQGFLLQKLNYMHNNPCNGNWNLAKSPVEYPHSSAKYYITGEQGIYNVTNFMEMQDIDLTGSGSFL
jgi:REP element-mobilizing transposase RayT